MPQLPTYNLERIKNLIEKGAYKITTKSKQTALQDFGLTPAGIAKYILGMKSNEFYKTMRSLNFPDLWQDVYRTKVRDKMAYVKLQEIDGEIAVIISFKEL